MTYQTDEERAKKLADMRAARKERGLKYSQQPADENLIRIVCKHTPNLEFSYIGNFDSWGDERLLYVQDTPSGANLWTCEAKRYDKAEACKLSKLLTAYRLGAGLPQPISLSKAEYMKLT